MTLFLFGLALGVALGMVATVMFLAEENDDESETDDYGGDW